MQARDIMTRDVTVCAPEDEVSEALTLLGSTEFSGMPVVDEHGEVVGMVTEADLVGLFQPHDRTLWIPVGFPPFLESVEYGIDLSWDELDLGLDLFRNASKPVSSVMSSPAVTVGPDADLEDLLDLLADPERDINRLPVVDDGVLVGIVARQDLLSALREVRQG